MKKTGTYLKRLLPGLAMLVAAGLGTLYGDYVRPFGTHPEPSARPIPQAVAVLALKSLEERATEERGLLMAGLAKHTARIDDLRVEILALRQMAQEQPPKPSPSPPAKPKKQPTAWAFTVKPGAPRSTVAK